MGEFYQNGVKQYTWGVNDSMHPDFARRQAMQNHSYAPPVSKPMTFAPSPAPVWPTAPTGIRHVGRSRVAARPVVEQPSSRGGGFLKTLLVLGVVGGVGWWGFQHRAVQWPVAADPLYRPAVYRLAHGRVRGHHHHHHHHPARQT